MELKPPKKQTNNFSLKKLDCVSEEDSLTQSSLSLFAPIAIDVPHV